MSGSYGALFARLEKFSPAALPLHHPDNGEPPKRRRTCWAAGSTTVGAVGLLGWMLCHPPYGECGQRGLQQDLIAQLGLRASGGRAIEGAACRRTPRISGVEREQQGSAAAELVALSLVRAVCFPTAGVCSSPPAAGRAGLQLPTHVPVERCWDQGEGHLPAVPAGDIRGTALHQGQPDGVLTLPRPALHALLELPGEMPLLQRHLRGAAGGGAAVQRHPQQSVSVPGGLLCRAGVLCAALRVPTRFRSREVGCVVLLLPKAAHPNGRWPSAEWLWLEGTLKVAGFRQAVCCWLAALTGERPRGWRCECCWCEGRAGERG